MAAKVTPDREYRFVAECTLGRLCKWLRLAGFDTCYDSHQPDARQLTSYVKTRSRIILTRTKQVYDYLPPGEAIFIQHNEPLDQVRQVIRHLRLRQQDLKPLSRCANCNVKVRLCPREKLIAAIPDYIRQQHDRFHYCPNCQRIFWPGSHAQRCLDAMQSWFSEPSGMEP